ncbi:MAG: GlmU family protein [Bacteroidia bacterium]|nr:GlmU family protein [Bacteroidia bacterium]
MSYVSLFDPPEIRKKLLPFTFIRTIADIRIGILTIKEKWQHLLKPEKICFFTDDYLQRIYESPTPNTVQLFINSSILPSEAFLKSIRQIKENEALLDDKDNILACNSTFENFKNKNFNKKHTFTEINQLINKWDIFLKNGEEISKDFELLTHNKKSGSLSPTNIIIGNQEDIFVEEGVQAEACIFNTTKGKIYLGKSVTVMEGSMIRGPFAACENVEIKMGAKIYGPTTLGPYCKAGGELNNVVMFGYSNKGHDGFIGNSVIAEWCNLGADTNCSNLKNTYDNVKVYSYTTSDFEDSGLQFCGLFMADHVKCSINSMFNTGTTVGICCNIFDAGFPPKYIPSFTWYGNGKSEIFKLNKLYESIQNTMARRNKELSQEMKEVIAYLYYSNQS